MKFRITSIIAFFAAFVLSSCTLVMNDIDFPADQLGFTEPVTQSGPNGTVTYQFNDDVKSVAENVLPYVSHMENDSVLYYFDNTPTEYLPKVGECLSAPISRVLPTGLNHRVTNVEKLPGFYRITARSAAVSEIFEHYNGTFNFEAETPTMAALDSVEAAALGLIDNDITIVDFSQIDAANPDAAEAYKQGSRRSRAKIYEVDESKWKPDDKGINYKDDHSITLIDFDSRKKETLGFSFFPDLFKDVRGLMNNYNKWLEQANMSEADRAAARADTKKNMYISVQVKFGAKLKGEYNVGSQLIVNGKPYETKISGNVTVYPTIYLDVNVGFVEGGTFSAKAKAVFSNYLTKMLTPKMTKVISPQNTRIPIAGTPLAVYIRPHVDLGLICSIAGGLQQAIHLSPIPIKYHCTELYVDYSGVPDARKPFDIVHTFGAERLDKDPFSDDRVQTFPQLEYFAGEAGVKLASGFEVGVELFGVLDLGLDLGLVGTLKAGIMFNDTNVCCDKQKPTSSIGTFYDTYVYEKNGITCTVDPLLDVVLSAGTKELGRKSLVSKNFHLANVHSGILPDVGNVRFGNQEYDYEQKLKSFDTFVEYSYVKDKLMLPGFKPALVLTDNGRHDHSKLYVLDDQPLKNANVFFEITVPEDLKSSDKIMAYPAVYHQATGMSFLVDAEKKNKSIETTKTQLYSGLYLAPVQQVTGVKISDMESSWADWALKEFAPRATKDYYLYQLLCKVNVIPNDDWEEWGFELFSLSYYDPDKGTVEYIKNPYTIPIEKAEYHTMPIGVREVLFSFVDKLDAEAFTRDENRYVTDMHEVYDIDLQPYYKKRGSNKPVYVFMDAGTIKPIRYTSPSSTPVSMPKEVKKVKSYNLTTGK